MLIIESGHLEEIFRHAEENYPRECCGVLLGGKSDADWRVEAVARARNNAAPGVQDRYVMDPRDRLAAEEQARRESLSVVGFYHSHPDHEVYFSRTDLENSEEYLFGEPWPPPVFAYMVVAVKKDRRGGFGAFVVSNGQSEQIQVKIE